MLKLLKRLKIKSIFKSSRKRFKHSRRYKKVRLMYQDEAGFGRISKLESCWAPKGCRPHVASHYIREYRHCYGAVDARHCTHKMRHKKTLLLKSSKLESGVFLLWSKKRIR